MSVVLSYDIGKLIAENTQLRKCIERPERMFV